MRCCNTEENDHPDGIEPCCHVRGPCCMCLPYDDAWMISSQVLAIVAFCLSWIWWGTFLISIIGLTLVQLVWCLRLGSGPMYAPFVAMVITTLSSVGTGIYCFVVLRRTRYCSVFSFWADDFVDDDFFDYCAEEVWGSIAIASSALWLASAICILVFLKTGRHAKWEKKHCEEANTPSADVELAEETGGDPVLVCPSAAEASPEEGGEPVVAEAAVLDDVTTKLEEA